MLRGLAADDEVARWLDIDVATPCLGVIRRTWAGDHLISYARLIHPGDRYTLRALHTLHR